MYTINISKSMSDTWETIYLSFERERYQRCFNKARFDENIYPLIDKITRVYTSKYFNNKHFKECELKEVKELKKEIEIFLKNEEDFGERIEILVRINNICDIALEKNKKIIFILYEQIFTINLFEYDEINYDIDKNIYSLFTFRQYNDFFLRDLRGYESRFDSKIYPMLNKMSGFYYDTEYELEEIELLKKEIEKTVNNDNNPKDVVAILIRIEEICDLAIKKQEKIFCVSD